MKSFKEYVTESYEPPMVVVLKRKGIRNFPDGQRVALYHSDVLGIDVSVPYYANGPRQDHTAHAVHEETISEDYGRAAKVGMGFPKDTMHHVRIGQDMEYYHSKTAYRHHGTLVHKDHRGYHVKDQATGETHKFRYWNRKRYEKDTAKLHPKRVDEETIQETAMHRINKIMDSGLEDVVVFKNGGSARIHPNTAKCIMDLHGKVNGTNKKKIAELINTSPAGLAKVAKFAMDVKEG